MRDAAQVQALRAFHTDFHLLDAYSPKAPGGTGESFDWELARLHPRTPPVILSGGLTPGQRRRRRSRRHDPFAVDTASGTEAEPGAQGPRQADRVLPRGRAATGRT